jgi:hypothetical protein
MAAAFAAGQAGHAHGAVRNRASRASTARCAGRSDHEPAVTDVAISISLAVLLAAVVWCLWKYDGLKPWHAAVCILLGYYLAGTAVGPFLRQTGTGLAQLISGLHF